LQWKGHDGYKSFLDQLSRDDSATQFAVHPPLHPSPIMLFPYVVLPLAILGAAAAPSKRDDDTEYKYVALFSVDGLHASDVGKYVALRPESTIAQLLETGYEYTNAFTSAPSDSFPGTMFQFTGANPKTTGVWYDVAYDRTFYAPFSQSGTHCAGPPGAVGQFKFGLYSCAMLTMTSRV